VSEYGVIKKMEEHPMEPGKLPHPNLAILKMKQAIMSPHPDTKRIVVNNPYIPEISMLLGNPVHSRDISPIGRIQVPKLIHSAKPEHSLIVKGHPPKHIKPIRPERAQLRSIPSPQALFPNVSPAQLVPDNIPGIPFLRLRPEGESLHVGIAQLRSPVGACQGRQGQERKEDKQDNPEEVKGKIYLN
jgi:hypothetical protein